MRIRRRGTLILAVAALVTGPAVATTLAQSPCDQVKVGRDKWARVTPTGFDTTFFDDFTLTSHAVITGEPDVLLASSVLGLVRSADRGCTWQPVDLPQLTPVIDFVPELVELDTAGYNATSKRVYLLAQSELSGITVNDQGSAPSPAVMVSDDAGESFRIATAGLPAVGRARRLRVADGPDSVAYVAIADPVTGAEALWITRDAGVSWARTSGGIGILPTTTGSIVDFAVDSGRPDQVWAWDDETLYRSTDAGATFRPVPEVTERVSTIEFDFHGIGRISDVRVFHAGSPTADFAPAPNVSWRREVAPDNVLSVARNPDGRLRSVATDRRVLITYPNLRTGAPIGPVDASPTGVVPNDLELGYDLARNEALLVARHGTQLLLRNPIEPPAPPRPPPPLPPIGPLDECVPSGLPGTTFTPSARELVLRPGESRRVGYGLSIPPVPTDLDVNFMLDTTGSMSGVIRGLREDIKEIVAGICDEGVPVQFGLADFREFDGPFGGGVSIGGGPDPNQYPYRRRLPVSPVGPALREAIEELDTGGGATDGSDSALEAMLQAATGRGKKDATGGTLILAGEDAEFRNSSLKVIVLALDTTWREAVPGYPGPTYDAVVAELKRRGIRVVGLAIGERSATGEVLRTNKSDMQRIGRATRALAGPGGSDCDSDGTVDVPAGEPLVCVLDEFGSGGVDLAPAMVGLLNSIEDRAAVSIEVRAPETVAVPGGVRTRDNVDVKKPNRLAFDSVFTCADVDFGRVTPVTVDAVSRGRVLASTSLTVRCGLPPADPVRPALPPIAAAALAPPPPPPPPAPIPQTQPQANPNPNPQLNPQPNLQVNIGAAAQKQEQVEVALATVDIGDDDGGQLAMSGLGRDDPATQAAAALLAVGLTAGAAYGLGRRSQPEPARVPVRRS